MNLDPTVSKGTNRAPPHRYVEASLMIVGTTLIGLLIAPRWGAGSVVLLYLPAVLASGIYGGLWPAVTTAVASTLAYNYFFTAPYRSLLIYSPADAMTVTILFFVALVTSRLASSMREHTQLARAHASRNATIAGLARRLLQCASVDGIGEVAVQELARLLGCNAVLISGRDELRLVASAPGAMRLTSGDMAAAAMTIATGDPSGRGARTVNLTDWQFHAVASDEAVIAAVGLARDDGMPPVDEDQRMLLANLLDQVALAFARAQLESEARALAATRERDRLRAVLLASIGEDVTPRLRAIVSAARGLRREGTGDRNLVSTIVSEASQLDRYVDNLVDLSPGSDNSPLQVGHLAIDLYRRSVSRDGEDVHLTPKEYAVLAELAKHAGRVLTHGHLLRAVWGPAQEANIDYLRVAVRAIRQKIERDPARPALILNEPAIGYRLAVV